MKLVIDIEEAIYKECIPYKDTPIISNLANYNSEIIHAVANGTLLPKEHGRIGDLSELEIRIGNFIEHYNHLLKETNPEALVYMHHILDGIIDTDTIIEADTESEEV